MITGNATPLYKAAQAIARIAFRLAGDSRRGGGAGARAGADGVHFRVESRVEPGSAGADPRIPGRTSAFLKSSLMKIPILGYGMKLGEFVPVDREGRVESAKETRGSGAAGSGKRHPHHYICGGYAVTGRTDASVQKRPVLPGNGSGGAVRSGVDPRHRNDDGQGKPLRVRPGTAYITFHEPLDPGNFGTREELMDAVRAAIASGLPEWMSDPGTKGPGT